MSSFLDLLVDRGEMSERLRAFDWASTPLGPPDGWPQSLRMIVRTCLESPLPINLWSGLAPMLQSIRAGGPPVYAEDARFVMQRAGERPGEGEDAWFTFALSAVRDGAGEVVAFFNPASETTGRILAERELTTARETAERAESRLRDVLARAPAFLAVVRGTDHVFEFVNEAYLQLVGHRDIIGKAVADALPEVRGQEFVDLLDGVRATGEPFVGREVAVSLARIRGAPPE